MKLIIKDKEIVAGCQADNPKSQRLLYNKYAGIVMGTCLRYLPVQADAEDAAQEIFIKIFTKISKLKDPTTLPSWIKTIATNTLLDILKSKSQKQNQLLIPIDDQNISNIETATSDFLIPDPQSNIPAAKLLQLVQELPTGYRTVFNLCAIDEYSSADAAKIIGCTPATVRSQLHKARLTLQEKIKNIEIN